jgi:HopA1 effector protein family
MSSVYRQVVEAALEALRIDSPTSYSWYGEASPPLPPEVIAEMGEETARGYLCDRLQEQLYTNFYCSGRALPPRLERMTMARPGGASLFTDSLSRANTGTGSRESGWRVVREEGDGRLVVRRGGLSLWARPGEVRGADLGPGSEVSVTMPPELLRLSPGFYMALGNEELDVEEPIVRHYWHLSSHGGVALVAAGTRAFNQAELPFRLKVLIDPDGYSRCDAGVLYTPRRFKAEVADLIPAVREAVAEHLRPGTPAFTKRLADGLGVAEDPPGYDSFGTHRCRLLADAMVRAFELGLEATAERLDLVERHFAEHGVEFAHPYLNAGSADEYELVS